MFLDDIVGQMSMEEAKATSQRLDAKCWKGKHKEGTKVKGGVRVNNCVPNESQTNEVAAGGGAPAVPSDAQLKKMIWDALKIDAPTGKEALQKAIINLSQRPQTPMVKNMLGRIGMIADNMNIGPEYRTLLKKFVEDSWSSETTPWGGQDPFTSSQHEMVEDQLDEYPIQGPSPDDSQSPIHGLEEEFGDSPVTGAITRRILMQRADLLKQYGPELVGAAIDNVADYVGDVDEIGSSDVSGWVNQVERMLKENPPEAFREGWSDAIVAQRTGSPRTPYSVYIKGKKWKDFADDDHAENVANKLKAKFKADGRDPSVITIAPTDMSGGVAEAEKKGLYYNVNKRKAAGTSRPASSPTAPTAQAWKDAAKTAKKESVEEAETDYSKRRQRERDVDAGKPVAKQRQSKMTDYQKKRAQDKKDMELGEMDKSQKGPAGWNLDDYDYSKGKWTQGKPVTAKDAVSDMAKDLDRAFNKAEPKTKKPVKESYWTKLQSERSTKLNTLVNELKESVKDIK